MDALALWCWLETRDESVMVERQTNGCSKTSKPESRMTQAAFFDN